MYQETMVLRNLAVLGELVKGPSTSGAIANATNYRKSPVERSLGQLIEQGYVEKTNGTYILKTDSTKVHAALELVTPWLDPKTEAFYEIARSVAKIILTRSWSGASIRDVLLYGDVLKNENSRNRDIDMVILHAGNKLEEFQRPEYTAEEPEGETLYDISPTDSRTRRLPAFSILLQLGYKDNRKENVARAVGQRIEQLDAGTLSEQTIKSWLSCRDINEQNIGDYLDINGTSNVFDLHVMHTGLLGDRKAAEDENGWYKQYGEARFLTAVDENMERYSFRRKEAMQSCRDPTFWHRVLSEGRLFDHETDDFTLTIEDKYPGALELFEVK
ncbi:MAG: hypothetical protein V1870_03475 [Candidatus Aenigmatarchaeota archaeon]